MKYSFAGFGMVMVGLFSFIIVMVFQSVTINNEADYYSLKEAMEASLLESIDIPYYRSFENGGNIKIVEEKFIENFTRRFVKNTMGNSNGYILEFYDIMESPPKASVIIKNKTGSMSLTEDGSDFDVVNALTGILVHKAYENSSCEHEYVSSYYYSYVDRNDWSQSSCVVTNKTAANLNGTGQLLRAYSVENDSNYTYSYDLVNYDYSFYNVCLNNNNDFKGNGQTLYNLYQNFVGSNICGYPFYKNSSGYVYSSNGCVSKMIDIEQGGTDFTVTDESVAKINFANYIQNNSNYLEYYASDIEIIDNEDLVIEKADPSQVAIASNGNLSDANNLYFISWSGSCEKQNTNSGFCSGYAEDNVLMVMEILWDVTKCRK